MHTLKCLCWCAEGEVRELIQAEGTSEDYPEVWLPNTVKYFIGYLFSCFSSIEVGKS